MNRPPCAERGPHCVDESSDSWDTIDWLVKNVPNNNGRVGALGISYPGWLTDMTAIDPHPALKAISPQAPMGDTWMGDDFFHQGAFRQSYGTEYSWLMEASKDVSILPAPSRYDTYDWYLSFPNLGRARESDWRGQVAHLAPDRHPPCLRRRVEDALRAAAPDAHDGADAVGWRLVGPGGHVRSDRDLRLVREERSRTPQLSRDGAVVARPWAGDAGTSLGKIQFGSPTGEYYRREIQARWFRHYLHDGDRSAIPEAQVFDAGSNEWRAFDSWPPKDAVERRLYFQADEGLSFDPPTGSGGFDEYVSDPAHPVPYRQPAGRVDLRRAWVALGGMDDRGSALRRRPSGRSRLADRSRSLRTSVSPAISSPRSSRRRPEATPTGRSSSLTSIQTTSRSGRRWAATSCRSHWTSCADATTGMGQAGGDRPQHGPPFTVDLHQQAYTFKAGHRIMVQVQSTWFPL